MVKFDRAKFYQLVASFEFKVFVCMFLGSILVDTVSEYTTSFNGATCGYVKNDEGAAGLAEVAVRLNLLKVGEQYDASSLKFPVLLFKYTDRENFTNIPTLDEFRKYYTTDGPKFGNKLIDSDNNKFRLDVAEGKSLNIDDLYNDYIMLYDSGLKWEPHMRASFNVKRSGLYCAYIGSPNVDGPDRAIMLGIGFKNSFGDLNYYAHLLSSQMKYFVVIGSVMAFYLHYYSQRFINQGDSCFSFRSISSISLCIKRLFTGIVLLNIFSLISFNIPSSEFIKTVLLGTVFSSSKMLEISIYATILNFALGYGIITAINSKLHMKEPSIKRYSLLTQLGMFLIIKGMSSANFLNAFNNSYSARLFSNKVIDLFFAVFQLLPVVWIGLILSNFKITNMTMVNTRDIQYLKPFNLSLICLNVSPVISATVTSFLFKTSFMQVLLFNPLFDIPASITSFKVVYFDLINTSVTEVAKLDPNLNLASIWSQQLTIYVNVIFLFFMWIKDNKGLLYVIEDAEAKYEPLDSDIKEAEQKEAEEDESEEIHA
ncbi:hypothetical protein DFJ63DRAFT_338640 [Scheffersomyces coipomensis]|uniref:uncharacterized protein n=1 Tax=Scheffersomyces coipomensis TaxID=1788519 RepID=UPI00315C96A6